MRPGVNCFTCVNCDDVRMECEEERDCNLARGLE